MICMLDRGIKKPQDIRQMKKLWSDCFNDPEEFTDYYFSVKITDSQVVIMKEEDRIIGMVHLNPYSFIRDEKEVLRTVFVVGVAVEESYRNQGIMKKLMQYAISILRREGIRFIYLWPEHEELYTSLGFRVSSQLSEIVVHREDLDIFRFEMLTPKCDIEFAKLRRNLIMPQYSEKDIAAFREELRCEKGIFITQMKKEVPMGYFSLLSTEGERGRILRVEHMVPLFGLREYMTGCIHSVENYLNHEENADIKRISFSMDSRLVECFSAGIDRNQIRKGHSYMVAELSPGCFHDDILFTEVV